MGSICTACWTNEAKIKKQNKNKQQTKGQSKRRDRNANPLADLCIGSTHEATPPGMGLGPTATKQPAQCAACLMPHARRKVRTLQCRVWQLWCWFVWPWPRFLLLCVFLTRGTIRKSGRGICTLSARWHLCFDSGCHACAYSLTWVFGFSVIVLFSQFVYIFTKDRALELNRPHPEEKKMQEPHERYRCKTKTKPTAANRQNIFFYEHFSLF